MSFSRSVKTKLSKYNKSKHKYFYIVTKDHCKLNNNCKFAYLFTHIKDPIIIQKGFDDCCASPQQLICTCQRILIMWYVSLLRRLHCPVLENKWENEESTGSERGVNGQRNRYNSSCLRKRLVVCYGMRNCICMLLLFVCLFQFWVAFRLPTWPISVCLLVSRT